MKKRRPFTHNKEHEQGTSGMGRQQHAYQQPCTYRLRRYQRAAQNAAQASTKQRRHRAGDVGKHAARAAYPSSNSRSLIAAFHKHRAAAYPSASRQPEDVRQDVYLKLLEKVMAGKLSPEIWHSPAFFWRCVGNHAHDLRRKQCREEKYTAADFAIYEHELAQPGKDPMEILLAAELREVEEDICRWFLENAVRILSRTEFQVWWLRVVMGLGAAEVQTRLRLACRASVHSRLSAARRKLTSLQEEARAQRLAYLNS